MTTEIEADRTPANESGDRGRSIDRWLPTLAVIGGLALFIAGVWAWTRDSSQANPGVQLEFLPVDQDLGPVQLNELRKVAFRVINRDYSRPARVLGIEEHCNKDGCIFWRGAPTTIPPGTEVTFEVEWKGVNTGKQVQHFPVYTDCPGQAEVRLNISGDVIAGERKATP